MKLKDFKPTYDWIELIIAKRKFPFFQIIGIVKKEDAYRVFGEMEICSVKDYHHTQSTSIVLEGRKGEEI